MSAFATDISDDYVDIYLKSPNQRELIKSLTEKAHNIFKNYIIVDKNTIIKIIETILDNKAQAPLDKQVFIEIFRFYLNEKFIYLTRVKQEVLIKSISLLFK